MHIRAADGSAGDLLGRVEFIHSSTLSMKGVCMLGSHKACDARGRKCFLLLHAFMGPYDKYRTILEWLKTAPALGREDHVAEAARIRARVLAS